MTYALEAIADRFIELAGEQGLTHMQLQKLVYLAHELSVRRYKSPLVDCNPQVWQYGPVFSRLYHQLKIWKNKPITQRIDFWESTPPNLDDRSESIIKTIWERFGRFSGVDLSNITHAPGTPWRQIAEKHNYRVPSGTEITVKDILEASNGIAPVS